MKPVGQVAYEAYRQAAEWTLTWKQLSPRAQNEWHQAGQAVVAHVLQSTDTVMLEQIHQGLLDTREATAEGFEAVQEALVAIDKNVKHVYERVSPP